MIFNILQQRLSQYLVQECQIFKVDLEMEDALNLILQIGNIKEYWKKISLWFTDYCQVSDSWTEYIDNQKLWIILYFICQWESCHLIILKQNPYSGQQAMVKKEREETK